MKNNIALIVVLLVLTNVCFAQTQIFIKNGIAIGNSPGNEFSTGSYIMPEVIKIGNGNYRMYYVVESQDSSTIRYAESSDSYNWTVLGTIMTGSLDTNDRDFRIGGPSVIELPSGQYRMYYRCSPKHVGAGSPEFHMRSAISNDGINFTFEQIVMEIQLYDTSSMFSLVGQGSFYNALDGTYCAIFSAEVPSQIGASDLYFAKSNDGLNWTGFQKLFEDWHDPIVIKKDGLYHVYATYLTTHQGVAVSVDGYSWTAMDSTMQFQDSTGTHLTRDNAGIGDIGGVLTYGNEIRLFSNYADPSKNLANFNFSYSDLLVAMPDTICAGDSAILGASFGNGTYTWLPTTGLSSGSGNQVAVSPGTTTTYTVSSGTTSATVTILVNQLPNVQITAPDTICSGTTFFLSATGASSYIWSSTSSLSSTTTLNTSSTPSVTSVYFLEGTDINSCTNSDSVTVFLEICTGIDEEKNKVELSIYPNPSKDYLTIQISGVGQIQGKLSIIDVQGKVVCNQNITESQNTIDIAELPRGVYALNLILNNTSYKRIFYKR